MVAQILSTYSPTVFGAFQIWVIAGKRIKVCCLKFLSSLILWTSLHIKFFGGKCHPSTLRDY